MRGRTLAASKLMSPFNLKHNTFIFISSIASRTQPTVPSPPQTKTLTALQGSKVQSWSALAGAILLRSKT